MAEDMIPEEEYFEDDEIYTLVDEDGVETEFELIGKYMENGVTYNALIPCDGESEEYVIFRREVDEDGEVFFITIEDDDEFDHVADIFEDSFRNFDYDETEN